MKAMLVQKLMRRKLFVLVCFAIGSLLFTSPAYSSTHFTILLPLMEDPSQQFSLKSNSAQFDITSDSLGDAVIRFWMGTVPGITCTMNANLFCSSADSTPNLFSVSGNIPVLMDARYPGSSEVILRITGRKNGVVLDIPPVEKTLGTGFGFPIGDVGRKTTIFIGNPNGVQANIVIREGCCLRRVEQPVNAIGVGAFPIVNSNERVVVSSDVPVILMLEIIDNNGNITRTMILPG